MIISTQLQTACAAFAVKHSRYDDCCSERRHQAFLTANPELGGTLLHLRKRRTRSTHGDFELPRRLLPPEMRTVALFPNKLVVDLVPLSFRETHYTITPLAEIHAGWLLVAQRSVSFDLFDTMIKQCYQLETLIGTTLPATVKGEQLLHDYVRLRRTYMTLTAQLISGALVLTGTPETNPYLALWDAKVTVIAAVARMIRRAVTFVFNSGALVLDADDIAEREYHETVRKLLVVEGVYAGSFTLRNGTQVMHWTAQLCV